MMKDLIPGCPNSGHNTIRDHTKEWLQRHIKGCVFLAEKGLGMLLQDSLFVKTQKRLIYWQSNVMIEHWELSKL